MSEMSSGEPWDYPAPVGLYDPAQERDACGVGFIVSIDGIRTNKVSHMRHRVIKRSKIISGKYYICLFLH